MKYRSTRLIWVFFLLAAFLLRPAFALNQSPKVWWVQTFGGVQNTNQLTFKWDGSDPDGNITNFYYKTDDTPWQEKSSTFKQLTWYFGSTYGNHSISVKAKDNSGAESSTITSNFYINAKPTITINSGPQNNSTINSNTVTFTWSGSDVDQDIDRYECQLDGGSWQNCGTNTSKTYTGLSEGTHTFSVRCRDTYYYYSEPATRSFTVSLGGLPDLIVTNPSVSPTTLNPGGSITMKAMVKNVGNVEAGSSTLYYYLSNDTNPDESEKIKEKSTPSLGPNETSSYLEKTYSIPTSKPAGTYYVIFKADGAGEVTEGNEANNTSYVAITIGSTTTTTTTTTTRTTTTTGTTSTTLAKPDLIVESISVSPSNPTINQEVNITYTIKNQGNSTSTAFFIQGFLDGSNYLSYQCQIPKPLNPGESWSNTSAFPWNTRFSTAGVHTIRVAADVTDAISESNENNNEKTISINVSSGSNQQPTLSSGSVSPSSGTTSTSFTYSVTYQDSDGDAPTVCKVKIDGTEYDMTKVSGSYTSGAIYQYTKSGLAKGSHSYSFRFNDGKHSSDVTTSTYSGPTVNNSPPSVTITGGPSGNTTNTSATFSWSGSDPDGNSDISGYYYELDDSTPDNWTTSTSVTLTGISLGSHTFYVQAKDRDGATSSVASRSFTVVASGATINVTVKKQDEITTVSGAQVKLYTSSWSPVDSKYTNGSGVATFTGLTNGTYNFEVWYNGEFWGNPPSQTVSGSNTYNISFSRYMPYGESVNLTSNKTTYNLGEQVTITVWVKNKATYSNDVKVELILDRDKSTPYDYDSTSSVQTISGGGTKDFVFNFTPSQGGTYYRAIKVYSKVNSNYVLTDSWAFDRLFVVFGVSSISINVSPTSVVQNGTVTGGGTISGSGSGTVTYYWDITPPGGSSYCTLTFSTTMSNGTASIPSYNLPTSQVGTYTVKLTTVSPNQVTSSSRGYTVTASNHSPVLSNDYVTPVSGTTTTNFEFYVTYKDADGDAPATAWVNIDGTGGSYSHTMSKVSGDYVNGALYKYVGSGFSVGTHSFNFYFSDGKDFVETGLKQFTVTAPNQPPQVTIGAPTNGQTVSGVVEVLVSAYDPEDGALTKIEYYVDNVLKYTDNSPDATSPASRWNWDTTTYLNGSHTLKVIGYDSKGATGQSQVTVTVNNVQKGNVSLTIKNVDGSSVGSAKVDRHDNSSWIYIDTATSDASGVARWTNIPAGSYMFKVWKNGEYWGYKSDVSVTAGNTTYATFTRYMPWGESVRASKATYNAGETGVVEVKVKNDATFSNNVKVELILDRDQNPPYDYVNTSEVQTIPAGSSAAYTFNFTANQSGTYYRAIKVYTNVSGTYTLTDSWAFGTLAVIPQLVVNLVTTEACGYALFDYCIGGINPGNFDRLEVWVDSYKMKTIRDASFADGTFHRETTKDQANVYYFTDKISNGQHVLTLKLFLKDGSVIEKANQIYVDNNVKVWLEKNGQRIEANGEYISFSEVENYKVVIRLPWDQEYDFIDSYPIKFPFIYGDGNFGDGKTLAKRGSLIGYEYEYKFDAYSFSFEVNKDPQRKNVNISFLYHNSLTDTAAALERFYVLTYYDALSLDERTMEKIDEVFKLEDIFGSAVDLASMLTELKDKMKYEHLSYVFTVKSITNDKYAALTRATKSINGKYVTVEFEIVDGDALMRIIEDGKTRTYWVREIENAMPGGSYANYQIGANIGNEFTPNYRVISHARSYVDYREVNLYQRAFSNADDAVKIESNFMSRMAATYQYDRYEIKYIRDAKVLRSIGEIACKVNGIAILGSVVGTVNKLLTDGVGGAAEETATLAGLLAGNIVMDGVIVFAGGLSLPVVGTALVAGAVAGGAVYILVDSVLPQPVDLKIAAEAYPGNTVTLTFPVINNDHKSHHYDVVIEDLPPGVLCLSDSCEETSFDLPGAGWGNTNYKNFNIRLAIPVSAEAGSEIPFKVKVVMDSKLIYYLFGAVFVRENPSGYLYCDPRNPFYQYYGNDGDFTPCPGVSLNYKFDEIINKPTMTFSKDDVNIFFNSLNYSPLGMNFSKVSIERADSVISLNVPSQGDAKILANSPAIITINNFSSNYLVINHNGTLVYENGVNFRPDLITNLIWDQTNKTLTFNVSHWDTYTIITDPALVKPQIKAIRFDGKEIVAGDYVSSKPAIEIFSEDKTAAVTSVVVEIKRNSDHTTIKTLTQALSAASAGAIQTNLSLSEPLPEGEYYALVTITDASGNSNTFTSPYFRVYQAFTLVQALAGPNPFSPNGDGKDDIVKISYQLTGSVNPRVKIRLVDLSGKLVKAWNYEPGEVEKSTIGYNCVEWDGKDENGNLVNNGLYLAYILAEAEGQVRKAKVQIAVLK